MISLLITVLVIALIAALLFWVISLFPLPAPWGNVLRAVVALILVIWIIETLLPMAHSGALLR